LKITAFYFLTIRAFITIKQVQNGEGHGFILQLTGDQLCEYGEFGKFVAVSM
jgi:hypothetical protein